MANINKAKLFDNASKFIQKNQLDRAIKELNKILKADPDDVRARLKIGDLYAKKGQTSEACEAYRIVAESYSNDGFFLKAVAVYKQILKLDPSLTEVHLKLGDLYHQLGLVSDAMQQYQIVANFYQSKGMNRESLDVLRRMVDLDPENIQSRKNVAELLAREGHVPEALEEFRQIASDLEANNRVEDLVQVLERICHLAPDDVEMVKRTASLYLERGDPKRSLAKLQVLFRTNPQDLGTLDMLSRAFLALNQPHKAKSVYREMAKLHETAGEMPQRDDVLRRILDLDPNDPEAQSMLAGGPPASAPVPAAVDDPLTGAMPAGPVVDPMTGAPASPPPVSSSPPPTMGGGAPAAGADDPATISKLLTEADVYLKYGLLDRALDHLRNIVHRNPDNFEAHSKLKEVYLQHKDTDNAVAEILILATMAEAGGRPDEARALLEEGMQIAPGHPELSARMGGGAPIPADQPVISSSISPPVPDESASVEVNLDDSHDALSRPSGTEELPMDGDGIEVSIDDASFDADVEIEDPFAATDDVVADVVALDDHRPPPADPDSLIAEAAASVEVAIEDDGPIVDEVSVDLGDDFASDLNDSSDVINVPTDTSFEPDVNELGGDFDSPVLDEASNAAFGMEVPDIFGGGDDVVIEDPAMGGFEDDLAVPAPFDVGGDSAAALLADAGVPDAAPPPASTRQPAAPAEIADPDSIDVVDEIPASVAEDVDEAEFFISQEIYDEAIRVFEKLLKKHPGNTALMHKLAVARQAEAGEAGEAAAASTPAPVAAKPAAAAQPAATKSAVASTPSLLDSTDDSGGFEDLADLVSELDDFGLDEDDGPELGEDEQYSMEEVFRQFQKGIETTIGQEDKQARFDLGLAYKDMDLFDEAIKEFEIAMQDPARQIECMGMIAVVQREKGDNPAAIQTFRDALAACQDPKQKPGLLFDLALTLEGQGDKDSALDLYREVQAIDKKFRGVAQKIKELEAEGFKGGGDSGANGASNPGDKAPEDDAPDEGSVRKSKISYV